jgi:DNA-binding transcriptional regulator YiaG
MPRPEDKAALGAMLRKSRQALRVTAKELAAYLGGNLRTFQKWEQGRVKIDKSTWALLQMAVRVPEVRKLLAKMPVTQPG